MVEALLGFNSGSNKKVIKANRDNAEALKDGYNFAYQVRIVLYLVWCMLLNQSKRSLAKRKPTGKACTEPLSSRRW